MMFLSSFALGLLVGAVGFLVAPPSVCPRLSSPLLAGLFAAVPGAVLGLSLTEDWLADVSAPGLALSVVAASLAVVGVAFLPEREATQEVESAR